MTASASVMPERVLDAESYPPMLNVKQAAQILNCSERCVTRMCKSGAIQAVKVTTLWRINRDALMRYAGLA